jgi:hypothetical protein
MVCIAVATKRRLLLVQTVLGPGMEESCVSAIPRPFLLWVQRGAVRPPGEVRVGRRDQRVAPGVFHVVRPRNRFITVVGITILEHSMGPIRSRADLR